MERRHYITILEEHEGPTWDTLEAGLITEEQLKQILAILALTQTLGQPNEL